VNGFTGIEGLYPTLNLHNLYTVLSYTTKNSESQILHVQGTTVDYYCGLLITDKPVGAIK
jgi:hypothetical protein